MTQPQIADWLIDPDGAPVTTAAPSEVAAPAAFASVHPGQMRLCRIQLHNWGTFHGGHELDVPRKGLLLTGESGSGKSSILDAISAVLMRPGETRFNAAAQDGPAGDRDRTPMSYVRGAYRKQSDDTTGEVRPGYLRPAATVSGIALGFEDGRGRVVTAVRVLHVAGNSSAAAALRTAYLLFDREFPLAEALALSLKGIDRRRLKRALSPLCAEDTYTKFGVLLRRETGIGSEAAQRLLHRTQSAKSLTSLDALLRDFMLDAPATLGLADQAVDQFRALQDAHATVVDARHQVEVLLPQRELWATHRKAAEQRDEVAALKDSVDAFQSTVLAELAERDLDRARVQCEEARHERTRSERGESEAAIVEREAAQVLLTRGGTDLQLVDRDLAEVRGRMERIDQERARLLPALERLDAQQPETAGQFAAAQALARRERTAIAEETDALRAGSGPLFAAREGALARIEELSGEIRSLRSRRSKLPSSLVAVRDELAEAADESPTSLPFAGELMDVRDESWQGAVERLLHSLAITILVPERLYDTVSRTVEGRHWGQRVSYERVRERRPREDDQRQGRTVLSVLQLSESPLQSWLRARLSRGFPHVLVEDVAELARHERALTRAGQIKTRDLHVKDDRYRVEDRRRWVIGTNNLALLELQARELDEARTELAAQDRALADVEKRRTGLDSRSRDLDRLLETSWEAIDRASAAQDLVSLEQRRTRLLSDRDLAQLQEDHRRAEAQLEAARSAHQQARDAHRDLEQQIVSAEEDLGRARHALEVSPLPEGHRAALETRVTGTRRMTRATLPDAIRAVDNALNAEFNAAERALRTSESKLSEARTAYLGRWRERSANLVDALDATPDFLAILSRLESDRLPDFEDRFRHLLRTQSQNNIGQLRSVISQAIRDVHQRLAPVNESLQATAFDTERRTWLTLVARQRHTDEVTDFLAELLAITQGAFGQAEETTAQIEERFARMDRLLRRLGSAETAHLSWRRRVLDTRLHVEFVARELDESGEVLDIYRGSDGRSGGQRQRLVTFCLAAALRYQLTDRADGAPPYGTVVLDEAFDKTDIHFTRAGLEVFRAFGFQLLLATPLKMLQTIEEYVGGAAVVSKSALNRSTVAAISFTAPAAAGTTGQEASDRDTDTEDQDQTNVIEDAESRTSEPESPPTSAPNPASTPTPTPEES
jgi:uncharacterized protein YPO0396